MLTIVIKRYDSPINASPSRLTHSSCAVRKHIFVTHDVENYYDSHHYDHDEKENDYDNSDHNYTHDDQVRPEDEPGTFFRSSSGRLLH